MTKWHVCVLVIAVLLGFGCKSNQDSLDSSEVFSRQSKSAKLSVKTEANYLKCNAKVLKDVEAVFGVDSVEKDKNISLCKEANWLKLNVKPANRDPYNSKRQRFEIKVGGGSKKALKARKNDLFVYDWYLRWSSLPLEKAFTHIFQLKGYDGGYKDPLLTFTVKKVNYGKSSQKVFQVRYRPPNGKCQGMKKQSRFCIIIEKPYTEISKYAKDKKSGIRAQVKVRYRDKTRGSIHVRLLNASGVKILDKYVKGLDTWIPGTKYIRPKWGLYRGFIAKEVSAIYLKDLMVTNMDPR